MPSTSANSSWLKPKRFLRSLTASPKRFSRTELSTAERVDSAALSFYSIYGSNIEPNKLRMSARLSLFLVSPEIDLTVEIAVSPEALQAVALHLSELKDGWAKDNFCRRLGEEVGRVLPDVIDWRLKPPTKAQLALAKILCRQLGVDMPTDALTYRGEMFRFLERHKRMADR